MCSGSEQRPITTTITTSVLQLIYPSISPTDMISDDDLYRLAIFLGSAAMLLIILYHFLEVNSVEEPEDNKGVTSIPTAAAAADTKAGTTIR